MGEAAKKQDERVHMEAANDQRILRDEVASKVSRAAWQARQPNIFERWANGIRVADRCQPHMDTPCWEWQGALAKTAMKYGVIGVITNGRQKKWTTHRLSYELNIGPIPPGVSVCHKCDNATCSAPHHLFLGTQLDNMRDAAAKGRTNKGSRCNFFGHNLRGEESHSAVLTKRDVLAIRASSLSEMALAKVHGVSRSRIGSVRRRESWAHIPEASSMTRVESDHG